MRRQSRGLIVEYTLEWTGEGPARVRLVDRIPTSGVEEFGFHEDHAPSEWDVTDGDLDVEAAVEPGAERRLVFGLIADGVEPAAFGRDEPVVQVAPTDEDRDGTDFFDRARESILDGDGPADEATEGVDDGLAIDLDGPEADADGDGSTTGPAATGRRIDADGGVVDRAPGSEGNVVSALVAELEAGTVPDSELDALREHLGDSPESEAVRLEYVQKRLSDFDAYVDALEDLISVHGSGDDAITDLDERLETLTDEVEAVRRRQGDLADRVDDLSAALEEQAETLEDHRVTHESDVEDLRTEIRRRGEVMCEEFSDLQQALEADLAALEAEIDAFESIRRALVDGLQRPDDLEPATTVEDADPGTLAATEEIPIVDPSAADDGGAAAVTSANDDPALEAGADGASTAGTAAGEADLADTLETAEASNFSSDRDVGETEQDEPESPDAGDGQFAEAFVRPAAEDGVAPESDTPGSEAARDAAEDSESDGSPDDESLDDGEFVVPGPDVREGDAEGATPAETNQDEPVQDDEAGTTSDDGTESGDSPDEVWEDAAVSDGEVDDTVRVDFEGDGADGTDEPATESDDETRLAAEAANEGDLSAADGDGDETEDADDDADDDPGGRASSIFEIGDVDAKGSGDDTPTIDFEDA